jgi:hypothetical protein
MSVGAGKVVEELVSGGQFVVAEVSSPVSRFSTRHHTIAVNSSSAASAMTAGNGRRSVGLTTRSVLLDGSRAAKAGKGANRNGAAPVECGGYPVRLPETLARYRSAAHPSSVS